MDETNAHWNDCKLCGEERVEEAPHDPWYVENYCANPACDDYLKGVD